jgi:hypothetical protein
MSRVDRRKNKNIQNQNMLSGGFEKNEERHRETAHRDDALVLAQESRALPEVSLRKLVVHCVEPVSGGDVPKD